VKRKGVSVTGVIRDRDGKVLLVKHSYGHLNWELPGGGVEAGESVQDAVVREVREETGLDVDVDHLAAMYDERDEDFLQLVFACRARGANPVPRSDHDENSDCGFWPVEALPRPISDYTVRRVHDVLTGRVLPMPAPLHVRNWIEP
jgi:8-oxo-dGTP diphosphatase